MVREGTDELRRFHLGCGVSGGRTKESHLEVQIAPDLHELGEGDAGELVVVIEVEHFGDVDEVGRDDGHGDAARNGSEVDTPLDLFDPGEVQRGGVVCVVVQVDASREDTVS